MSEKKKTKRFEPKLGDSIKQNWMEIGIVSAKDAGLGAGAGVLLSSVFGVGSTGLNAGIGAGAGAVVGFAEGTLAVHHREERIASMANEVLDEVASTIEAMRAEESVADVVKAALEFGVEYLKSQGAIPRDERAAAAEKEKGKGKGKEKEARA